MTYFNDSSFYKISRFAFYTGICMIFHDKYSKANSQSDAGSIRKGSYRLRIIFSNIILVNADLKCHTSYHRIHTLCGSLERFVLEFQIFKLENRSGLLANYETAPIESSMSAKTLLMEKLAETRQK